MWESLKRAVYYSENFLTSEREKYLRVGHKFLVGGGKLASLLNYNQADLVDNTVPGINFPARVGGKRPDLSFVGQNDFLLPPKNSIVSQTGTAGSAESLRRKRALLDTPKSSRNFFLPAGNGASSHLFEKNMQDEKSLEMNVKRMLETTAVELWNYSDSNNIDLRPLSDIQREVTDSHEGGPMGFLSDGGEVFNATVKVEDPLQDRAATHSDLFYTNVQTNFRSSEWYSSRTGGRGKVKTNFTSSGAVFVEGFASGNSLHKSLAYAKDIGGLYLGKYRYGSQLTHTPHIGNKEIPQKNTSKYLIPNTNNYLVDIPTALRLANLSLPQNSTIVLEIEKLCKSLQILPTPENIVNLVRLAVLETIVGLQPNPTGGPDDNILSIMYTWFGKLGVMSC